MENKIIRIGKVHPSGFDCYSSIIIGRGVCSTLGASTAMLPYILEEDMAIKEIGNIYGKDKQAGRIYDANANCPTMTCNGGGGHIPLIMKHENKRLKKTIENANLKEGEVKSLDLYNQTSSEMAHTLSMPNHNDQRLYDGYRVRKLTPRECFRLMGVKDEDFDKIKDAFSDTTLYHLAGDSIVTNVIMSALAPMFNKEEWYYDYIRSREDTM